MKSPPASSNELGLAQLLRRKYGRELVKKLLSPFLQWRPLKELETGHTLVVGVPWDLRKVLSANLLFLSRVDRRRLREILIVFDRRWRPEMDLIRSEMLDKFPDLPLRFLWYPKVSGRIVERVNVSTFYNSMNTVLAIATAKTRTVILHDFDLYPLRRDYFNAFQQGIEESSLRFCGLELTNFDGLCNADQVMGTWALAIDAQWLRSNWRPIDCFHRMHTIRGKRVSLDPYSWLQLQTPERGLVRRFDGAAMCHIKNMCSTYLRYLNGEWAKIAWRLHSVWYLEELSGSPSSVAEATEAMDNADGPKLEVGGLVADFSGADVGAVAVLSQEIQKLEEHLHGKVRPRIKKYISSFSNFVEKHGRATC